MTLNNMQKKQYIQLRDLPVGYIGMYSLHIVYSLHILHIVHNFIYAASLALAFHARLAKYLHLVQAEERQSKPQLNCCRPQRNGTKSSHQHCDQRDFRDRGHIEHNLQ